MAERILAKTTTASGTLAVAGNAHTPTGPTSLGVPLGAYLARQRLNRATHRPVYQGVTGWGTAAGRQLATKLLRTAAARGYLLRPPWACCSGACDV
jgi:hypothetical protein